MRVRLGVVLAAAVAVPLHAQDLPTDQRAVSLGGLRPLASADDARGWEAVGRLDTGRSFCSATLITPDLVLTAAHCMYDSLTGQPWPIEDMTFSAGLRNGHAVAQRGVREALTAPGYAVLDGVALDMIEQDLALLVLQQPIRTGQITPIAPAANGRSTSPVTIVSYGEDREVVASIEEDCQILARDGAVRALSCTIASGSSGAPVLRLNDGVPELVAVVSARAHVEGEEVTLAVVVDDLLESLMARHVPGPDAPIQTTGGLSFIGQGNDGRDRIGARFIRP